MNVDSEMSQGKNDQKAAWIAEAKNLSASDIVGNYYRPQGYQSELAKLIDEICKENQCKKVIEAGCETGVTSMLLAGNVEKTFLDYNPEIIDKVKEACQLLGIEGTFVVEDMGSMSAPDKHYDLLFNSGVLEHYSWDQRVAVLKEYHRVLHDQGMLVIAIPNHYSFPYRSAYLLKKKFLKGYQWPWPTEFKIYNLESELAASGFELMSRQAISKSTIFAFWAFSKWARRLLVLSDLLFSYEGYLTVLIIRKHV